MKQWWGGAVGSPAEIPHWAENSVGDRFFSQKWVTDAAHAPAPADATLPEPSALVDEQVHWEAAMSTLFRGVILDGVPVDDARVLEILGMLAPVLRGELAQVEEEEEEWGYFEETTGPLFLLGGDALISAAWAVLGDDPVAEVIPLLERRMRDALDAAGYGNGTDAKVLAETLILAMTGDYGFEEPADVEALEHLGAETSGNVLLDLIDAKQVAEQNALRFGLVVLVALANLARTDDESILSA